MGGWRGRPNVHRTLAAMAAATLLVGCGWEGDDRSARELAMEDARAQLGEVSRAIGRARPLDSDEYARAAASVQGVEVMEVSRAEQPGGDGVTLVVRVHGTGAVVDWSGAESDRVDLPVCFRLTYGRDVSGDPVGEVECPTTAPVEIPEPPTLPNNLDQVLRRTLPTGRAATEPTVRAAVDRLKLDPRARRDVASAGDVVGVALSIPRYDCLLARIVAGKLEVWVPDAAQLVPGELTCTAETAVAGHGQRPKS